MERIRRQFCERGMGLFEAPSRKTRSDKKIDGSVEAHILAVSCSEPPAGQSRWKLQTIADRVVELGVIDHIGATSMGVVLKKNEVKPWRVKAWVIPPKQNAAFVCQMEQVLSVYERPYAASYPVVCLDESPRQLIEIKQERKSGGVLVEDSEYIRM